MKKLILISLSLLIAAFIAFGLFIAWDIGQGIEGINYKGKEARARINAFLGFSIPDKAKNLFYREEGFMDNAYYIAMEIPETEAWKIFMAYTGKTEADFLKADNSERQPILKDAPQWNIGSLEDALIFSETIGKGSNSAFRKLCYSRKKQRLMIYYSSN